MKAANKIIEYDIEGLEDGRIFAVLQKGYVFAGYRSRGKSFTSKKEARAAEIVQAEPDETPPPTEGVNTNDAT